MCGNGSVATLHPYELFGEDWMTWGLAAPKPITASEASPEARSEDAPPHRTA